MMAHDQEQKARMSVPADAEAFFNASERSMPQSILADFLVRAATALDGDDQTAAYAHSLLALESRLRTQRLQLAVLGQFKRGKSSFINGLIGSAVLPTAVIPLTALATFITWHPTPIVRITFASATPQELISEDPDTIRAFLHRFVAEESNPENRLNVTRVELGFPAPLLVGGTTLIDTPGIGSTHRHNTDAALRILPECDAALFVISADPPITETEINYLQRISTTTAKIILVVNKIDYLERPDQDRIVDFLRSAVAKGLPSETDTRIFPVSARDALRAKQSQNALALKDSGLPAVEEFLTEYLAKDKVRTLQAAVESKFADILDQAFSNVALRIRALEMPLEELTEKNELFTRSLANFERERLLLPDLLTGEKRRLLDKLEARIAALRTDVTSGLSDRVNVKLKQSGTWDRDAAEDIRDAIETAFTHAQTELIDIFTRDVADVTTILQDRLETLISAVRRNTEEIFAITLHANGAPMPFKLRVEPYWITQRDEAKLIPDPFRLFHYVLPATARRRLMEVRITSDIGEIVLQNAENLRWSILRSLDDTFREASVDFQHRVEQIVVTLQKILTSTIERRRNRTESVNPEIVRLRALANTLAVVREAITDKSSQPAHLSA
jgi:GTP-binding protein EngB required for normal cell division